MFVLFCLFIGNTLTPLTALTPVSDVGKTMLQPSSLSVLGDHQQFQAGLFVFICFCLFVYFYLFCLFLSISQKLLTCSCACAYFDDTTVCQKVSAMKFFDLLQLFRQITKQLLKVKPKLLGYFVK